ncbi:WD repeat-containing protein 75-like [Artemia franciscana]|uniref:WD repeat-containing protein 75 second beta-propeller domain-containing protein n=1 Tax=Artemia franciscana TaxID=6661 RepID=A0AA88HI81_ARTSF|nr:hypothetical protein QYM36_015631 [Artemia franciscana]KAK2708006.1 hypothetical protein QYM36_015631 [Artemia franciscana]
MKLELKKVETSEILNECPPEVSLDGEYVFISAGKTLRIFKNDGQFFCNLDSVKGSISQIISYQNNVSIVCTTGQIHTWNFLDQKLLSTTNIITNAFQKFAKSYNLFQVFPNRDIGVDVVVLQPKDETMIGMLVFEVAKSNKSRFLFKDVESGYGKVAIGGNKGSIVAAIKDSNVCVEDLITKKTKRHFTNERKFTCVALHPTENVMATGDLSGRIQIWHDFIENSYPPKADCHWHSLPVKTLRFTSEGSYLLSGGGECALVKWQLKTHTKSIIPRLSSPIKFITVSEDGSAVLITFDSNCITIMLGTTGDIVSSIQGIIPHTRAHLLNGENVPNPAGLTYHPVTKTVVSNAQTGHLQFQKINEMTIHQNLDVTQQNYVSDERQLQSVNTDVVKVTISKDNQWMVTVEHWEDPLMKMSVQLTVKTWKFDGQNFVYNSSLHIPHDNDIKNVLLAPFKGEYPTIITTGGKDKCFKVWKQKEEKRIIPIWLCSFVGEYLDLPCNYADFCFDSSLLAVAFGNVITCWSFKSLVGVLRTHIIVGQYKQIAFSQREETSQLLAGITDDQVIIWNIISASFTRVVDIRGGLKLFFSDRENDTMAVVTKSDDLFVFTPDRIDNAIMKKLDFNPIGGCLMAKKISSQSAIQSRIVLLSSTRDIYLVDDSFVDDYIWTTKSQIEKVRFTPFASLKNKKTTELKQVESYFDRSKDVTAFLNNYVNEPSITLPPTTLVLEAYENLLLMKVKEETSLKEEEEENSSMDFDLPAERVLKLPKDEELCSLLCNVLLS